jgi:hypothetical protein
LDANQSLEDVPGPEMNYFFFFPPFFAAFFLVAFFFAGICESPPRRFHIGDRCDRSPRELVLAA